MNLFQFYFSPKGRIGRLDFFLKGIVVVFTVFFLVGAGLSVLSGGQDINEAPGWLMGIFIGITVVYSWVVLMLVIKRFHDLNRSGWNMLMWFIPLVGQFIYLFNLIELFFVKGVNPNRFGADPNWKPSQYVPPVYASGPAASVSSAAQKACPSCGVSNRAGARFCSACGKSMETSLRGYCTTCHKTVETNEPAICPTCQNALVDIQPFVSVPVGSDLSMPESTAISRTPTPTYAPLPEPEGVSARTVITRVALALLGLAVLAIGVIFILNRAEILPEGKASLPIVLKTRTPGLTATPRATSTPKPPTPTPTPTSEPFASAPGLPDNLACTNGAYGGLICMSSDGWKTTFGGDLPFDRGQIDAMTTCPGGKVLFDTSEGLLSFDGQRWKVFPRPEIHSSEIACGVNDEIWVVGYSGAARLDGESWTEFAKEQILGVSETDEYPRGIAISPDGTVWVALNKSLAHYTDGAWTIYREGQGFNKEYIIADVVVDSQSNAWAAYSNGLLAQQGDTWKQINLSNSVSINTLSIDAQDRIWVGTSKNLWTYDKGQWKSYNIERGGQSDPNVLAVSVDSQGRAWVGTRLGLNVVDESGRITTYHMHTSPLQDNRIEQVIVTGSGPPLVELAEEAPGKIRGKFTLDGQPLSKARVEACMTGLGTMFTGSTPCTGEPFFVKTTTDENGEFLLDNLPEGYYSVTVKMPEGGWKVYSCNLCFGSKSVLVTSGQTTTLDTLDLNP